MLLPSNWLQFFFLVYAINKRGNCQENLGHLLVKLGGRAKYQNIIETIFSTIFQVEGNSKISFTTFIPFIYINAFIWGGICWPTWSNMLLFRMWFEYNYFYSFFITADIKNILIFFKKREFFENTSKWRKKISSNFINVKQFDCTFLCILHAWIRYWFTEQILLCSALYKWF